MSTVGVAIILNNDDDIVHVTQVGQAVVIFFLSSSNFECNFNGEDDEGDPSYRISKLSSRNTVTNCGI
jgi:hypothetical protein